MFIALMLPMIAEAAPRASFGWDAGDAYHVEVVVQRVWGDGHTSELLGAYDWQVEADPDGLHIVAVDPQMLGLKDEVFPAEGVTAWALHAWPVFVVDPKTAQFREMVGLPPSDDQLGDARSGASDDWRDLVSRWVGEPLKDRTRQRRGELTLADEAVATVIEDHVELNVPCSDESPEPLCVRFRRTESMDPSRNDVLALGRALFADLGGGAVVKNVFVERSVDVVSQPDGLFPHSATVTRRVVLELESPEGHAVQEQTDVVARRFTRR